MIGVYSITNKQNNKKYIGESLDIEKRWKEHISDLNSNKHHSYKLQKDWNKYGVDEFTFGVEKIVESVGSNYKDKMNIIIQEHILFNKYDSINSGYNVEDTLLEVLSGRKIIFSDFDKEYLMGLVDGNTSDDNINLDIKAMCKNYKTSESYVFLSREWFEEYKDYNALFLSLGSSECILMICLIMRYYNRFNESRISLYDIEKSFNINRRCALTKISILDSLQDKGYLTYTMPYKDLYVISDLKDIFNPKTNYIMISEREMDKITNHKETVRYGANSANMITVLAIIKKHMNKDKKISFMSESKISEITNIVSSSIVNSISVLKELHIISYINRGYNKATKRNLGNVYTLYSEDAEQRLEDYIRKEFRHAL